MPRARKKPEPPPCRTTDYARAVVAGVVVAGRLVRLACERHLKDLEAGAARGLHFDRDAAQHAFDFFERILCLPCDGELDGMPFTLQPFQAFIVGSIFGWKTADGYRRFRTAYVEQGKGNGKTPLAAGIGLYGLVLDGEAGAEIYPAATTREQAGILFRDAKRMAEASPSLRARLDIGANNVAFLDTDSFLRPVSSEHRGLDGKRPHMALIDEIHEHPTPMVVDKMRAGTKGRRQALIFEITNSGYDRNSVCWHHHDYSAKILDGLVENDAWFAYVCQLDPCAACRAEGQMQPKEGCPDCDDWRNERAWPKANPNLGVSIQPKYLREQVQEAKGMPTKEGIVKRLNFCLWTDGETRAIPMDRWDAAAAKVDAAALAGRLCFGGLDIGSTSDFTALVLMFPHDDSERVEIPDPAAGEEGATRAILRRSYTLLPYFWLPERPLRRDERMAATIALWKQQGHVRETPGEVVDYDIVLADIVELSQRFEIKEVGFDRGHQGCQIGTNILKRFGDEWLFTVPQGILSMNAPFRELIELLKTGRLFHDGSPVMRWMASNTVAEERQGLSKPSKDRSAEKIDGVTAATMALARAMLWAGDDAPMIAWM